MNKLLLETNQAHSRKLFFGCLFIALVLVPLVLHLVERFMSALHAKQTQSRQQAPEDADAAAWDLRAM
jgi:hypothetical protein